MKKIILLIGIAGVVIVTVGVIWLHAAPTSSPSLSFRPGAALSPVVGATAVTPQVIVVNTPTEILITTQITDPTVIANGVNLLKIDSTGRTIAIVGVMHDDGVNGDALPRDQTFSVRLTVNESTVGATYYLVSAAFRGVLKRVVSNPIVITVYPFRLPPDPGEAGKQTLQGVDSDHDGVRDDVQRYIGLSYSTSQRTIEGLTMLAKALQTDLSAAAAGNVTDDDAQLLNRAINCVYYVNAFPSVDIDGLTLDRAQQSVDALISTVVNTKLRADAYATYNESLGGIHIPDVPFETACSFNPSTLLH